METSLMAKHSSTHDFGEPFRFKGTGDAVVGGMINGTGA
jgi:hypothetical protein